MTKKLTMKSNIRTLVYPLFALLLISSSASAFEGSTSRLKELELRVQQLQQQIDEVTAVNAMGEDGIETATARPEVYGKKWFVSFDVLYWHPKVWGTAFAYTNNAPSALPPLKGRTKDIGFGWDWGIRAGVGRNFYHDKWDLYFTVTVFRTTDSGTSIGTRNNPRIPLKGAFVTNGPVHVAKSEYHLHYVNLDLELGRHYFISGQLSLRPYAGVKNAWIDQEQITRYYGGQVSIHTAKIRDTCDFWGIGPKMGIGSRWHLGYNFHLYGGISAAFLYGLFDVDHKEKLSSSSNDRIRLKENEHRFTPTAQFESGLGWGRYFNDKQVYIDLQLGYEGQYWWRQNQMLKIYEYNSIRYEPYSEDLSLHGITFKAKVFF